MTVMGEAKSHSSARGKNLRVIQRAPAMVNAQIKGTKKAPSARPNPCASIR